MEGQISIFDYLDQRSKASSWCSMCICNSCLYYQSGRCLYGTCWDDERARQVPYDKAHPDKPPRTWWSHWETDQAYWCRGGIFHPVHNCEHFVKYTGCKCRECIKCNVLVYQDGYIGCSLVVNIGCEQCYREFSQKQDMG